MGPELSPFQDKCFICLLDLDIQSILRCVAMPCCGKFLHRRCFRKAEENSFQCGHCRRYDHDSDSHDTLRADESMDDSPVWQPPPELRGPTIIEMARNAIADLRSSGAAHEHHQPGSALWDSLPYPIDVTWWYLMWVNLDWFISTVPDRPRPLYIHAVVYTPVDPVQPVRKTIYRLVKRLIPAAADPCISFVRFRLRFRHIADIPNYVFDPNQVTFTNIRFTRFWSPAIFIQDYPFTTEIPNANVERSPQLTPPQSEHEEEQEERPSPPHPHHGVNVAFIALDQDRFLNEEDSDDSIDVEH